MVCARLRTKMKFVRGCAQTGGSARLRTTSYDLCSLCTNAHKSHFVRNRAQPWFVRGCAQMFKIVRGCAQKYTLCAVAHKQIFCARLRTNMTFVRGCAQNVHCARVRTNVHLVRGCAQTCNCTVIACLFGCVTFWVRC